MPRKILTGTVVSHKMNKTAVVCVKRIHRHPLYKKNVTHIKKYAAHDEANAYHEGEIVQIRESRPFSKTKKWEVLGLVSSDGVLLATSSDQRSEGFSQGDKL